MIYFSYNVFLRGLLMYPFRKLTARILTAFALMIGFYSLYVEYFAARLTIPVNGKLTIALMFVTAMMIAAAAYSLSTSDISKKYFYIRNFLTIIFVYYLLILFNMLFFDSYFGREVNADLPLKEYLNEICNFRPFATVRRYLFAYELGTVSRRITIINLLGNFCAFMPMGVFLPILLKKCRKPLVFIGLTAMLICGVELLQIITRLGIGDIDDIILNMSGALLAYCLMQLPFIKKLWQRL